MCGPRPARCDGGAAPAAGPGGTTKRAHSASIGFKSTAEAGHPQRLLMQTSFRLAFGKGRKPSKNGRIELISEAFESWQCALFAASCVGSVRPHTTHYTRNDHFPAWERSKTGFSRGFDPPKRFFSSSGAHSTRHSRRAQTCFMKSEKNKIQNLMWRYIWMCKNFGTQGRPPGGPQLVPKHSEMRSRIDFASTIFFACEHRPTL